MTSTDEVRQPMSAFNRAATLRPQRWMTVVALVVLGIAVPLALWDRRGPLIGALALLIYGLVLLVPALNHRGALAWSNRHVAWDASLVVPLMFLGLAYLTSLSLVLCVAFAIAAGAVLAPLAVWRRGGQSPPDTHRPGSG